MASATTESSPLLPDTAANRSGTSTSRPNRTARTVTFNPTTQISSQPGSSATTSGAPLRPAHSPSSTLSPQTSYTQNATPPREPMLSAFNSKLRRRNSHGAALPTTQPTAQHLGPRIGAQRTTKKTEKLKLLPNPEFDADGPDEESGRDVYSQFTRIKDPTARRDAARLGKADRDRLPRVTAYCTAQGYRLEGVVKWMKSRQKTRGACPKLFDECLYSWWDYGWLSKRRRDDMLSTSPVESRLARIMKTSPTPLLDAGRRYSDSAVEVEEQTKDRREQLIDLQEEIDHSSMGHDQVLLSPSGLDDAILQSHSHNNPIAPVSEIPHPAESSGPEQNDPSEPQTYVEFPEVFVFDYGTIVIWGMTVQQEQRFLNDIAKFAESPLPAESIQTEDFNFYYTKEYQARIYNDFISLRDPKNNMTKLAISHALSQSVKTSLFEDLVSDTIETTSPLPALIAQTGSVNLTRRQLNMQIGELFILRINIHLQGSVLDSPELMWAEPHLEPIYAAVRSYLEIGQRVTLLTGRLDVIADLLAVLREQGSRRHGEVLEWIVIVLIAAEIVVAVVNILVDLWAGVE